MNEFEMLSHILDVCAEIENAEKVHIVLYHDRSGHLSRDRDGARGGSLFSWGTNFMNLFKAFTCYVTKAMQQR